MATMADDPYVHHVPTITGGNGTADVRDFYGHHFIGQWPDDTETPSLANGRRGPGRRRTAITFTHDRVLDIMLPGIPPTGRRIAVPVVVVVGFEDGKVHHEHIYWDQATVLVQAGLLDPAISPSSAQRRPRLWSTNPARRTSCSAAASEPRAAPRQATDGRGWFRTTDLSRVKRALSH